MTALPRPAWHCSGPIKVNNAVQTEYAFVSLTWNWNARQYEVSMQLTMPDTPKPRARFVPVGALTALAVLMLAALGFYFWYSAGKLTFSAETASLSMAVISPGSGRLAFVDVHKGQAVLKGQILARFDDGGLGARVEEQRRLVAELALTLPPEHIMLPAPDGGQESLAQQEERRRLTEQEADARLQAATEAEAQAAIIYQRTLMLTASGALEPAQRDAAEQALAEARRATAAERAEFERQSLQRADSSADIRRLKELQYLSGADKVPARQRLGAYRRASAALALSESELAALLISAPADGVITNIAVQAGQTLAAADFVMELTPTPAATGYRALLPLAQAEKLRAGQACRIALTGRDQALPGVLRSVLPVSGKAESEVWIAPLERTPDAAPGAMPGAMVEVTVFLRQDAPASGALLPARSSPDADPALRRAPPAAAGPVGAEPSVAAPSGAAPPAAPLSVQTPFGDAEDPLTSQERSAPPPQIKAGSPAALGRAPDNTSGQTPDQAPDGTGSRDKALAPLALPPMTAPKRLSGSPLPSLDNNPSIVRPSDLEPHESRP